MSTESDKIPAALRKPSGMTMAFLLMAGVAGGGGVGTIFGGAASAERLAVVEERTKSIEKTVEKIERAVDSLKDRK